MPRLWLVRHGSSIANAAGIIQGQRDYALDHAGVRQAWAVANALGGVEATRLISSPLTRARATAEVIAAATGLEIETDDALMEYDYGERSGITIDEIEARFPEIREARDRGERHELPSEEGRANFGKRAFAAIEAIRDAGEPAIVVSHGGFIGAFCYELFGLDHGRSGLFRPRNASITVFGGTKGATPVLERFNDTCHLPDLEPPPHER